MEYVERRLIELGVIKPPRKIGEPIPKQFKYPPGTTEKPCTMCKVVKPLDEFSELKTGALGRSPRCKSCICALGKDYHRTMLEAKSEGRTRPTHCDACGVERTLRRALHWDHDHVTGKFRGWLCHYCNVALGSVKDNAHQLQQLIEYLKRGGGPP